MTTQAQDTSVRTEIVVDAPVERAFRVFTHNFDKIKPREHNMLAVEKVAVDIAHGRRGLPAAQISGLTAAEEKHTLTLPAAESLCHFAPWSGTVAHSTGTKAEAVAAGRSRYFAGSFLAWRLRLHCRSVAYDEPAPSSSLAFEARYRERHL